MHSSLPGLASVLGLAAIAALAAPSAQAQDAGRPVTDRTVTAVDVAATPISDLNLRKDEIPAMLIAAQTDPYDLTGLRRCAQIAAKVGELDAMLGEDIDLPQPERGRLAKLSPGRVAQSALGSFIPFRSIIREVSGANDHQRQILIAIQAGMVRRAFLKGTGLARGCRYPARPATAAIIAARVAEIKAAEQAETSTKAQRRR